MPGVSIKVELDDKGVQQGTQRVENQFKQMETNIQQVGQRGNVVFTELTKQQEQVATSAQKMGDTASRALASIASGAELSTASLFSMIGVLGVVAVAVVQNRDKIADWAQAWNGNTDALRNYYDMLVKTNRQQALAFATQSGGMNVLGDLNGEINRLEEQRKAVQTLADAAGQMGVSGQVFKYGLNQKLDAIDSQLHGSDGKGGLYQDRIEALKNLNKLQEESNRLSIQSIEEQEKQQADADKKSAASADAALKKRDQAMAQMMSLGDQWETKGLSQADSVDLAYTRAYDHAVEKAKESGASQEQLTAVLNQILEGYIRERMKLYDAEAEKQMQASDRAAKKREADEARVTAAAAREAEQRERITASTTQLENETAMAMVPQWARGYAQIEIEHTRMIEHIRRETRGLPENDAQVLELRNAEWNRYNASLMEENRRMTEQLASDLESWADSIASGHFFDRIEQEFKKFVFKMVASWLLGMNQMRGGANGQGQGSLLGAMFGGLFGIGGNAGGGGGGFSLPGFSGGMATTPGFNGAPVGTQSGGSIISGFPGLGNLFSGSGSSAPFVANHGGAIPDTTAPFDIFGNATSSGLVSRTSLNFKGLGNAAGAMMAMGLGGTTGTIGAGISSLAQSKALDQIAQKLGISSQALGRTLVGVGAGISGFGIGMNSGKFGGIAGGALSGALSGIGFGPVGIAIGAIAGAVGGLFGGIMGGQQRDKQAKQVASAAMAQFDQVVDQYKGFQIDFASAISGLGQINSSAQSQLGQLKGEGDRAYRNTLAPAYGKAVDAINGYEADRTRRGALSFAPPMFHNGGFVGGSRISGWRMSNGEVAAVVQEGEFVSSKQSTARNRAKLEAMNRGDDSAGGGDVFYINAADALSFQDMLLKNGGFDGLKAAVRSKRREGVTL